MAWTDAFDCIPSMHVRLLSYWLAGSCLQVRQLAGDKGSGAARPPQVLRYGDKLSLGAHSLPHLAHYNKLAEECNEIRISKPGLKVKDILRQMPGLDEAPGECRQPHVPHAPHWYGCIERDGPPAWHRACDMPATATCHDDMCAWCTVLSHR